MLADVGPMLSHLGGYVGHMLGYVGCLRPMLGIKKRGAGQGLLGWCGQCLTSAQGFKPGKRHHLFLPATAERGRAVPNVAFETL